MTDGVQRCLKCGAEIEFAELRFCTVCGAARADPSVDDAVALAIESLPLRGTPGQSPRAASAAQRTPGSRTRGVSRKTNEPASEAEKAEDDWRIDEVTDQGKEEQMAIAKITKEEKHTLVEDGTTFKGSFQSTCPVLVRGRVEGELETPSLTVSSTGAVHGKARVGKIQSEGELSGEFDADAVELSGSVKNDTVIRAQSLEVKLATQRGKMQVLFAECEQQATETAKQSQPTQAEGGNGQSRPPRHSKPPPAL